MVEENILVLSLELNVFLCKISQNYTDLRCLLHIKMLTQQANEAWALVAYCCGESPGEAHICMCLCVNK